MGRLWCVREYVACGRDLIRHGLRRATFPMGEGLFTANSFNKLYLPLWGRWQSEGLTDEVFRRSGIFLMIFISLLCHQLIAGAMHEHLQSGEEVFADIADAQN